MKIKVQKFQLGGEFASLAINYIPTSASTTAGAYAPAIASSEGSSSKSSRSSTEKDELSIKDVLKVFDNVKGLPIDVLYVLNDFKQMFEDDTLFSFSGKPSYSSLVSYYLNNIGKFNLLAHSKEQYDETRKELVANDSLDEIAIDRSGKVIVTDGDGIDVVSLKELKSGNYKALTNRELLNLRQTKLPFGDSIYTRMTGIGMDLVIKKINSIAYSLGSSEKKIEGYTAKLSRDIVSGLAILLDQVTNALEAGTMTIDGLYKNSVISKDQKALAELAVRAIYNSLTPLERTLLEYHTPGNKPLDIISSIVQSRTSDVYHFEPALLIGLNPDGTKAEQNKEAKDTSHDNPLKQMINFMGGTLTAVLYVTSDGNESMGTQGVKWPMLPKVSEDTSVLNMLTTSGIGGVTKGYGGITFGDIQLQPEMLRDVMFSSASGGMVVILPAKYDALGNQMVDLSLLDDFKEIASNIKADQGTKEWWNELRDNIKSKGLSLYLVGNEVDRRLFGLFLQVEAYTTDRVLKASNPMFKNSKYIEKEESSSELSDRLKTALSTDKDKSNYDIDKDSYWPWDWFGAYDLIYHGNVFIPLTNNMNAAANAWGTTISESEGIRNEANYLGQDKVNRYNNTGSEILQQ